MCSYCKAKYLKTSIQKNSDAAQKTERVTYSESASQDILESVRVFEISENNIFKTNFSV